MCVKFLRVSNRGRPITRCGYIWRDRLTGRRTCTILQPKACAILSTCESVATKIDTLFDESVHPSFLDSHDISLRLSSIPAFISHDILYLSQWSLIRLGFFLLGDLVRSETTRVASVNGIFPICLPFVETRSFDLPIFFFASNFYVFIFI